MNSFIENNFRIKSEQGKLQEEKQQRANFNGLGKWWGGKPLILVRAAILGCLMPASDNLNGYGNIFENIEHGHKD